MVLSRFGFGPLVHVLAADAVYPPSSMYVYQRKPVGGLHSGGTTTHQGCPLSPALFALALEPLAILLRADPTVRGIRVGTIEEKISLYSDDSLLYLADASSSLHSALAIFD